MANIDKRTAAAFDSIWKRTGAGDDEQSLELESLRAFETFFSIFPMDRLDGAEGFDLGCGGGRIARHVAPRAGILHCIDPSPAALSAARAALGSSRNVRFHQAAVDAIPLAAESQDFGYSLGVLHHVPDVEAGLRSCVAKLKVGAPFLLYLYYRFDNRPAWFRGLWRLSDLARRLVSRLPFTLRRWTSDAIAATVYWPLSRSARLLERRGFNVADFPLSYYRNCDWATLRSDSLDRFGTATEHRFTKSEMAEMMRRSGLRDIRFRDGPPHWVAIGYKA